MSLQILEEETSHSEVEELLKVNEVALYPFNNAWFSQGFQQSPIQLSLTTTQVNAINNAMSSGDNVSELTNDSDYQNETQVIDLINNNRQSFFYWHLQAGNSNLPSNGTESGFSYGNNSANDGVCVINGGIIEGMSVYLENGRSSGSATFIVTINNVQNNVAGQRIIIDGNLGQEGQISSTKGSIKFSTPLAYSQGDQIEVRAICSGFSPTSADSTVMLRMKENI